MTSPTTLSPGWARALTVGGALIAVLGLAGVAGWHTGNPVLVQLHPVFAPLWYSAAAALGLFGVGLAATGLGCRRVAAAAGAAVALLGLVAVAGGLTGARVGLDEWVFRPTATFTASRPGTPGLSAALGYLLAGLALVGLSQAPRREGPVKLAGLFGAAVVVLALVHLGRYVFGLAGPFSSAPSAALALAEVVALLPGGAALAAVACARAEGRAGRRLAPLFAGVAALTVTIILWQALTDQEQRRIHRMVQFEATTAHRELTESGARQLAPLFELMRKPPLTPRAIDEAMGAWANDFIGGRPGCLGLAWADGDGALRWARSIDGAALEAALFNGPDDRRATLTRLRSGGGPVLERVPRGWGGNNRGFLFYVPREGSGPPGGLLGVFRIQPFLDAVLNPNVAPGYAVVVSDGERQIFGRYAADRDHRDEWQQVNRVSFYGLDWQVRVWPTSYVMAREPVSLARVALVVGFVMVCLLTLAVWLAQTARHRARALEAEVHERLHAEKALRENEAKYRSLVENLENSVFLKDREGRYVASNKHFCTTLGRAEADVRGRTDFELYPPAEAERYQRDDREVLASGVQIEKEEPVVIAGQPRRLRIIRTPVKDDAGQVVGVLGIVWDVTQQRSLEDHVRQAQKMEAVGQLAGGIAHDFNNLLTAILGNLSLVLDGMAPRDPGRPLAQAAEKAATRAASLTAQLLGFARQARPRTQPVCLNALIDEVTALLGRTIDPRIRLESSKAQGAWPIEADPGQMTQVLMNLCLNARDAMPGQGRLTLETENVHLDETFTRHHLDARPGAFVRLRVSDTGQGMPPEVRRRIFEPFFTTKEVGKGTGLGLAMVFGIVKSHHGWIDCYSEVGQGTRFDIYLPRLQGEAPRAAPAAPVAPSRANRETILLADDEPMIRNLARAILEGQGYTVLLAEDGLQAVEVYTQRRDSIDLVILDLTMPNLSGRDAFRQIVALGPEARVVFASGYSADVIGEGQPEGILGFVNKPYRPDDLARAARAALDAAWPAEARG